MSRRPGALSVDSALAGQLEAAFRKASAPPPTPAPTKLGALVPTAKNP